MSDWDEGGWSIEEEDDSDVPIFIELTQESGKPLWLSILDVVGFLPGCSGRNSHGCDVLTTSGTFAIKETPQQLLAAIRGLSK